MKTRLTAEESAKLIELGVSRSKANGLWLPHVTEVQPFTLVDILDILPKELEVDSPNVDGSIDTEDCYLCTQWCTNGYYADNHQWCVFYTPGFRLIKECTSPELIDALYALLVWCLEKGYVKKGGKGNEKSIQNGIQSV